MIINNQLRMPNREEERLYRKTAAQHSRNWNLNGTAKIVYKNSLQ